MFPVPAALNNFLRKFPKRGVSDVADYLSYAISAVLLLCFALTISAKQLIGSPIHCWGQAQWPFGWQQYAENYCFSAGGFYWPIDQLLPKEEFPRPPRFNYYQWVPLVLLLQAAMFYLPNAIWKWTLRTQSVIDYEDVIKTVLELRKSNGDVYTEKMNTLIQNLRNGLELKSGKRSHRRILGCHLKNGNPLLDKHLSLGYMLVKLLYVASVWAQFTILRRFISPRFVQWCLGAKVELFTKIIMCELDIRELSPQPKNTYIVQCFLMINQWNEVFYRITGIWMLIIGAVALLSAVLYGYSLLPSVRRAYVRSTLYSMRKLDQEELVGMELMPRASEVRGEKAMDRNAFADALGLDGVLLLRFIEGHAGGTIAKEICEELFRAYNGAEEVQQKE